MLVFCFTNDIINTGFLVKGTYDVTNKVGSVAKTVIPKVSSSIYVASDASRAFGMKPSLAGFGDIGGNVSPPDSIRAYAKVFKSEMASEVTAKPSIVGLGKEVEISKTTKVVEEVNKAEPIKVESKTEISRIDYLRDKYGKISLKELNKKINIKDINEETYNFESKKTRNEFRESSRGNGKTIE